MRFGSALVIHRLGMLLLTGCGGLEPVPAKEPTSEPAFGAQVDTGFPPDSPAPNQLPAVAFLMPVEGAVYRVSASIRLEVLAGDPDLVQMDSLVLQFGDAAGVTEAPTRPEADGTVAFFVGPLALGDYTATVAVDDGEAQAQDLVHFSVVEEDSDGDGFIHEGLGGDDCDDYNAAIHPGADEVCDHVDQDCDGVVDDGLTTTWYLDADSDGFGDPYTEMDDCETPSGWSRYSNDCDDSRADVGPDLAEHCDHADNDCDGEIDEGVTTHYYADADADGYGDPESIFDDCALPAGYSANRADCDDADATVSPAATEICADGLDNDCDGGSNGCGVTGDVDLSAADATLLGGGSLDLFGSAVAGLGDINADGYADFVVGAPLVDSGLGPDAGAAYVYGGPVRGSLATASASLQLTGPGEDAQAGYSVGGPGDTDGDGLDDVLVGAWGASGSNGAAGAAFLVRGGASSPAALATADLRLWGEEDGDFAGWAVSGAGDVDGDGLPDLVVGAPYATGLAAGSGRIYLVAGDTSGDVSLADVGSVLVGDGEYDLAGYAVATAGDVNRDGRDDVIVGAPNASGTGVTWLWTAGMSGDGQLSAAEARLVGETTGDQAGYSLSPAGDVNADGVPDLLVGAPYHDYGAVDTGTTYVLFGPVSGTLSLSAADASLVGERGDDHGGWAVGAAGDMDGDGDDDVLIGAPGADGTASTTGAAYLVYGPPGTLYDLSGADARMLGRTNADYAGAAIAGAGDTDGDGRGDILIGAPYADAGGSSLCGTAYLVLGTGL